MNSAYDSDQDQRFAGIGNTPGAEPAGSDALISTAKQDLGELGDKIQHEVSDLQKEAVSQIGAVAEKAKGLASEQKDLLTEHFSGVADAIQKVAGELENTNSTSASYVRMVADGAKKLSDTVKNNDVDDIMSMAQQFGRDQPVAFMGAAALLGFAASRFALASSTRSSSRSTQPTQDTTSATKGGFNA